MRQAERKEIPSTLTPDVDNATVGSQKLRLIIRRYPNRVSPFFVAYFWKRGADRKIYSGRGGAPCAFRKAMGTCVSG